MKTGIVPTAVAMPRMRVSDINEGESECDDESCDVRSNCKRPGVLVAERSEDLPFPQKITTRPLSRPGRYLGSFQRGSVQYTRYSLAPSARPLPLEGNPTYMPAAMPGRFSEGSVGKVWRES